MGALASSGSILQHSPDIGMKSLVNSVSRLDPDPDLLYEITHNSMAVSCKFGCASSDALHGMQGSMYSASDACAYLRMATV